MRTAKKCKRKRVGEETYDIHFVYMRLCMHISTNLRGLSVKVPIYTYFILAATEGKNGKLIESSTRVVHKMIYEKEGGKELGENRKRKKNVIQS